MGSWGILGILVTLGDFRVSGGLYGSYILVLLTTLGLWGDSGALGYRGILGVGNSGASFCHCAGDCKWLCFTGLGNGEILF